MVLYEAFVGWELPKASLLDPGNQFKAHQLHGEAEYQYLMQWLRIEAKYGRRTRTRGKIENNFRFIRRHFVLENLEHTELDVSMRPGASECIGITGSIGTGTSRGESCGPLCQIVAPAQR